MEIRSMHFLDHVQNPQMPEHCFHIRPDEKLCKDCNIVEMKTRKIFLLLLVAEHLHFFQTAHKTGFPFSALR
jgi:hypothetical protein